MRGFTRGDVWALLYREGPLTAREIAKRLRRRKMPVYKALDALMECGKVTRQGRIAWHREYLVVEGSLPPEDGRGSHPNSRAKLFRAAAPERWQPCALADCWKMLPFSSAEGD